MPDSRRAFIEKFDEIRHQLKLNCEIVELDHPDPGQKIGDRHSLVILTGHVFDQLAEVERMVAEKLADDEDRVEWQIGAFRETVRFARGAHMQGGDNELGFTHLEAMLETIEKGEMSPSKIGRWLGWAQAAVAASGIGLKLNTMKEINRREKERVAAMRRGRPR